jgi:DNA polymerase-3 subunit alpha
MWLGATPSSLVNTHFSLLDGFGTPDEYARRWKQHGDYLCVSDHGIMSAVPNQIRACDPSKDKKAPDFMKRSLHPIFACELYVNPMQIEYDNKDEWGQYTKSLSPDEAKKLRKSYHLLAIAYNQTGYSNLVRLTSAAWMKGYYYRPRVNHEQLLALKEGIIFTSCCYNSEIGQAFDQGGDEAGEAMVLKYMAMFGDKFYLEMMLLDFSKQKAYNVFIQKMHLKYHIPVIMTTDTHFCDPEDSEFQRLMLMVQTGRTIQDVQKAIAENDGADMFELQDPNLWMKTEDEMNLKWEANYQDTVDYDIFKQAKRNTVEICRMAKGVKLDRSNKLPRIPDSENRLWDAVVKGVVSRDIPRQVKYSKRLREEYDLICRKDFCSYFLIQKAMTDEARRICPQLLGWGGDGSEAVGPARGSAAGSLLCYCLGITDVDPIEHDLLFSRFMSEARGGKQMKLRFSGPPLPSELFDKVA